jgi:hypothetical protein
VLLPVARLSRRPATRPTGTGWSARSQRADPAAFLIAGEPLVVLALELGKRFAGIEREFLRSRTRFVRIEPAREWTLDREPVGSVRRLVVESGFSRILVLSLGRENLAIEKWRLELALVDE